MEFSVPKPVLNAEKNKTYQTQLKSFFETYGNLCEKENGLQVFSAGEKEGLEEQPQVIQELNKILSSLSMFAGAGNLKIYKVKRRQALKLYGNHQTLARLVLVIGDGGFIRCQMNHSGQSTGRAPVITRLLEGGSTFIMKPTQDVVFLGDEKTTVFIRGKGKKEMTKPSNFEQFVVYYQLALDEKMLKNLKQEFMKTGNIASALNSDKIDEVMKEMNLGSLQDEMKRFKEIEESKEKVSLTKEEEEFMI